MSAVDAIDLPMLRARLEHCIRLDLDHLGSLYLRALGACYMAVDERSPDEEDRLCDAFHQQAAAEGVDGDAVLLALALLLGRAC